MAANYNYEIKSRGPNKWVVVYDTDSVIYTGQPSFSAGESLLVNEAELALEDNYPDIKGNIILRGSDVKEEPDEPIVPEPEPEPVVVEPEEPKPIQKSSDKAPEYKFNPPAKENAPTRKKLNDGRVSARIYNVFESTITLDEMSLTTKGEGPKIKNKIENFVSVEFPLMMVNGYIFGKDEIDYFSINSNEKIPKITISASFTNEMFLSRDLPKDGDVISVMVRSKSDVLKPIRNDYVITGLIPGKRSTTAKSSVTMTFFGELFIPGFDSYLGSVAGKGTSMSVLKKLAKTAGLGFNTNEDDTDDLQIWYGVDTAEEFIEDVTQRAWKDENSFFDWWIDIYYNLNFINVQKQLLSSETKIDSGALVGNVNLSHQWEANDVITNETAKVFSNYISFRSSSFFIRNWRPINKSSKITFDYGTSLLCTFYEHNKVLYDEVGSKKYWELNIPPAFDPTKLKSHILLRGRSNWDASINNGELAKANYNYDELYQKAPWLGIQYTISNPEDDNSEWTGNHHKNYMRARVHNTINNIELDKLNLELEVQGVNLNIIRGDKIPVALVKNDIAESLMLTPETKGMETLDFFYSGWYYVKGFNLEWTKPGTDDILSNFSQTYILTRREWPTPVPVDPIN